MTGRLKVLFLTHRLPYAPNRGDRLRAFHVLRVLRDSADVQVVSLVHDSEEAMRAIDMATIASHVSVARVPRWRNRALALAALTTSRPLTHVLLDSPQITSAVARSLETGRPDVVLAFCSSMTRYALEPPLSAFPLVIDMVDADSAKWDDLSLHARQPRRWVYQREARVLGAFEAMAMHRAYATVAVNAREVAILRRLAPRARIEVVENGVDLTAFAPPGLPTNSRRVVFCGVMNYEPNEAGARWLVTEVWPRVLAEVAEAELRIVGASPSPQVQALARIAKNVVVTGAVGDVRPELWAAAVSTAPLRTARGVQNKVLEAVAAGVPCVVTPAVEEGLPRQVLSACRVAGSPPEFAAQIVDLLRLTGLDRRTLARCDLTGLSWERRVGGLARLLSEAAHMTAER